MRKRVAVLISGRGSNMEALIRAAREPDYPAEIALVIANRPDAGGLATARAAGIAAELVDNTQYPSKSAFETALEERLTAHGIELIALAGFMRILSEPFTQRWDGRLVNIHPSLLPAFKGLHTHERALEAGVSEHGCTVHFVTAGMDEGPIIAQARVPVLPGDTTDTLAARVLVEEHKLYPQALALVAAGLVTAS